MHSSRFEKNQLTVSEVNRPFHLVLVFDHHQALNAKRALELTPDLAINFGGHLGVLVSGDDGDQWTVEAS